MFDGLEEAIKNNAKCHEKTADDLALIEARVGETKDQVYVNQNCLIGLFIFIIVNMMMTGAAIAYAIQARNQTNVNLIHLEHIEHQLDELRSKK